jgi:recombination protein RecA
MAEAKKGDKAKKGKAKIDPTDRIKTFMSSDTAAKLRKKYGKNSLAVAADVEEPLIRRIPWGTFPLDYATGGGVPAGRMTLLWGATSSGKTTGILKVLANAQQMCANCYAPFNPITGEIGCLCGEFRTPLAAMINAEGTWDKSWAQRLGVDTSQLLYNEAEYAEQAIDMAEALLRGGEVDIVLVDSVAALTPTAEIEESSEKVVPGGQARLMNRAIRTFNSAMNTVGQETGRKPTLILVNQLRHKIGVMYGSPDTMPGGFGQEFAAALVMKFWGGK